MKLTILPLKLNYSIFYCPCLEQDSKFRVKYVTIEKSWTKVTQAPNYRDYLCKPYNKFKYFYIISSFKFCQHDISNKFHNLCVFVM